MFVLTVDVGGLLLKRRAMVNDPMPPPSPPPSRAPTPATLHPREPRRHLRRGQRRRPPGRERRHHRGRRVRHRPRVRDRRVLPPPVPVLRRDLRVRRSRVGDHGGDRRVGAGRRGFAPPIVLDSGYLQGVCKVPDGIEIGDTCAFWYNNGDASLGDANWGFMNLDQWGVDPCTICTTPAVSSPGLDRRRLSRHLSPQRNPAGRPGTDLRLQRHRALHADWSRSMTRSARSSTSPSTTARASWARAAMSAVSVTPDKYDIIGFTGLMIYQVYRGNDPAAIGEPGASGTCTPTISAFTTGQTWNLSSSYGTGGGCPTGTPDSVGARRCTSPPRRGRVHAVRARGPVGDLRVLVRRHRTTITWRTAAATNLKISTAGR